MEDPGTIVWEQYLAHGDRAELLALIETNPNLGRACEHEYPSLHRLTDIDCGTRVYRVVRCVTCNERLCFVPLDPAIRSSNVPDGVPYELRGARLRAWVAQESEEPSKDEVDWQAWLSVSLENE